MRGLHRLVDHAAQVEGERLEVELVTEPSTERLQRACRVVAMTVEAPVHERLDARPRRPEQRRHREGRRRDRQARVRRQWRQDELEHQHRRQVGQRQRRRQRAVDERAVDHDVDVEEAVAQNRDGDGQRHAEHERADEQEPADVPDRLQPGGLADRRGGETEQQQPDG